MRRSWLFVPGDSERKLARAFDPGADVVILDLEDSVAPERKPLAREMVREAASGAHAEVAVRINPLGSGLAEDDLAAVIRARPRLVVLPKCERAADVQHLGALLAVAEAEAGIEDGATGVMAIATETATSLFGLGTYAGASPRLEGLAWGGEDLSTALGASRTREASGALTPAFALARTLCLAGAVAAEVDPIDTVYTKLGDTDGLRAECDAAAADGFLGKMAIHPAQVATINEAFNPSETAIAAAERIVAAFAAAPAAGVLSVDGEMVDRPHLTKAERLLARVGRG